MSSTGLFAHTSAELAEWVRDARARSLALIEDLSDEQLIGPTLAIVNPLLWEIGHVAWFQERWVLREGLGEAPLLEGGDELYNSATVPHDTRWELHLPRRDRTLAYVTSVHDRVLARIERLEDGAEPRDLLYYLLLSVFHEDMHAEAFAYTRQTLGYSAPAWFQEAMGSEPLDRATGDVQVPGGRFELGARPGNAFAFDNEKWAHPVEVSPFRIARTAVTQAQFLEFVEARGYAQRELWSDAGWRVRQAHRLEGPRYWRRDAAGAWQRRRFNAWVPLEPDLPVVHVSWHEAEAFCRFAGRRLPTEIEWEVAASSEPMDGGASLSPRKRRFPWGDAEPDANTAQLDWRGGERMSVHALPGGDSAFGCRQMIGNVWEWTSSTFEPYPAFAPDPYKEYSAPWFGTHKVLRGGAWTTRARLCSNTFRNFYEPHRRDVWCGFRTCATD